MEKSLLSRRQVIVRFSIAAGLLMVAFVATVIVLNSTLYSAAGFVRGYLSALARHDMTAALEVDGVRTTDAASEALLQPDALAALTAVKLVDDAVGDDGVHRVTYSYDLDGASATTTFEVAAAAPTLLFFSGWRFAVSPAATVTITPLHAGSFDVGSGDAETVAVQGVEGQPANYTALVPAAVTLSHESTYFRAAPSVALVTEPGIGVAAEVDVQANEAFVDTVQEQLDALLDDCTTQQVLQPTGCPFGERVENRIEGLPTWTMASYPLVDIVPGTEVASWRVPEAEGAAHLVVGVRSLFDGSLSTFDEDVPFTVAYDITFDQTGRMTITGTSG